MNSPASRPTPEVPSSPGTNSELTAAVVICTRNRPELLQACLAAVGRFTIAPAEVLVIDNSAGDSETEHIAGACGARYLIEPVPGLSRARNRACRESTAEVVAFLDDDAVPCEDWLSQILAPFADDRVASVTGDTLAPEDAGSGGIVSKSRPTRFLSKADPLWFEIANFGGLGFGTNMALRRRHCLSEPFFDERLGRGAPIWIAEESHAFTQLIARGLTAVHVPSAIVVHPNKPRDVEREATASFAYWLLLFFEFPKHRGDLIHFLWRRLRRKPLSWPRDPNGPGEIISSSWLLKIKALFAGCALYFRARATKAR